MVPKLFQFHILHTVHCVRMKATLAHLHKDILNELWRVLRSINPAIVHYDLLIDLNLHGSEVATDVHFNFFWELRCEIILSAPQHKRTQHSMQTANDYHLLILINFAILGHLVKIEERVKLFLRIKKFWHEEVKQRPQL